MTAELITAFAIFFGCTGGPACSSIRSLIAIARSARVIPFHTGRTLSMTSKARRSISSMAIFSLPVLGLFLQRTVNMLLYLFDPVAYPDTRR